MVDKCIVQSAQKSMQKDTFYTLIRFFLIYSGPQVLKRIMPYSKLIFYTNSGILDILRKYIFLTRTLTWEHNAF